ncbi:hypothetical protein VM1G_12054 [Cytospora mali]|uniref:Uncharacterized protein n=1 Tax=Cytospora mali TaxID=578113 RepID=A0A194VIR3_CYTMA|nr:hypothetical protein VM1G_12054 [Valsa mali]
MAQLGVRPDSVAQASTQASIVLKEGCRSLTGLAGLAGSGGTRKQVVISDQQPAQEDGREAGRNWMEVEGKKASVRTDPDLIDDVGLEIAVDDSGDISAPTILGEGPEAMVGVSGFAFIGQVDNRAEWRARGSRASSINLAGVGRLTMAAERTRRKHTLAMDAMDKGLKGREDHEEERRRLVILEASGAGIRTVVAAAVVRLIGSGLVIAMDGVGRECWQEVEDAGKDREGRALIDTSSSQGDEDEAEQHREARERKSTAQEEMKAYLREDMSCFKSPRS